LGATKVLIIDDQAQARRTLRIALISRGFEVTDARSGEEALENLRHAAPDVILVDLKMPGIGGIETCKLIRECSEVPIIIVSARKTQQEKVEALESGADDYITKPLGIEELAARIHAVIRRPSVGAHVRIVRLEAVEIDLESHEVKRCESIDHLTSKEFKLLYYFLQNARARRPAMAFIEFKQIYADHYFAASLGLAVLAEQSAAQRTRRSGFCI